MAQKCAERWSDATGKQYVAEKVEDNTLTRDDYRVVEENREFTCNPTDTYDTHMDNPDVYDVPLCLDYLQSTLYKPFCAAQVWDRDARGRLYAWIEFQEEPCK